MPKIIKYILIATLIIFVAYKVYMWNKQRLHPESNEAFALISDLSRKSHLLPYNFSFNPKRDSLGVPKLDGDWEILNSDSTGGTWGYQNRSFNKPVHLKKVIQLRNNVLLIEADYFESRMDSMNYRILYAYNFVENTWECSYSVEKVNQFQPSKGKRITVAQADSILNMWGLHR